MTEEESVESMEEVEAAPARKMRMYGTRDEVYTLQTARKTRGGLTRDDLTLNRHGRVVSKKKQALAMASYKEFGFKKREAKKPEKKKRRRKKKPSEK